MGSFKVLKRIYFKAKEGGRDAPKVGLLTIAVGDDGREFVMLDQRSGVRIMTADGEEITGGRDSKWWINVWSPPQNDGDF